MSIYAAHSGVNKHYFANALQSALTENKRSLDSSLASLSQNPDDPTLLADVQVALTAWNVTIQVNSTCQKTLKDMLQGILQRMM